MSSSSLSTSAPSSESADVNFPFGYIKYESDWQRLQPFLAEKGYQLRSRYRPGWIGSWVGTNKNPKTCEDSIVPLKAIAIDAIRLSDGKQVMLKLLFSDALGDEVEILQYFNSERLRSDPRNHTVELLDCLNPPNNEPVVTILVMPLLRVCSDPPMLTVGEMLSWGKQVLEGLEYMHSHNVAHRDVAFTNVLMDASRLYPDGFQSIRCITIDRDRYKTERGMRSYTRTQVPVKYYFIDFGLSVQYASYEERGLVNDERGQYFDEIPECRGDERAAHDPFKADIYSCGYLFFTYCMAWRSGLPLLEPLINVMLEPNPDDRPTAAQCVELFQIITRSLRPKDLRAKLGWWPIPTWGEWLEDWFAYLVNHVRSLLLGQGKTIE